VSIFSKEWLKNNTLSITDFQQLNITKSLEVLLILVIKERIQAKSTLNRKKKGYL